MDRSARRRARGSGETLAAPSTRARRRGPGTIVIDLDDDHQGAAPPAAAPASRRGASSSSSKAAAAPFVGAVATRTRSRSLAMQAEEPAPRAKRRRKGTSAETDRKAAAASKSASSGKRRAPPRRASEPAKAAESEAEAEAEPPACVDWVEVPRVNEADNRDDASDDGNGEPLAREARDTGQGNGERHGPAGRSAEARVFPHFEKKSCAGESRITEHPGNGVASASKSMNEVASGDAAGMRRCGGERGSHGVRLDVDEEDRELIPTAASEDDYDEEMLEERLVADLIRAYSNGGNLDANGVDCEAEDETEFTDDGEEDCEAEDETEFTDDAGECDMSEPMHADAKVGMQDLVDHKVVDEPRCHEEEEEEEDVIKNEVETKRERATGFNQGKSHIEILDSDEELKVLDDPGNSFNRKPLPQEKVPVVPCVAWRTRSLWGVKQDRLSYNAYFEELSDEPKEEDDDTEVELDDDEDGDDDGDNSASCDEEEEEEGKEGVKEEEEAEKRKRKKEIYSSFRGIRTRHLPLYTSTSTSRGKRIQKATPNGRSNSKARRQPASHQCSNSKARRQTESHHRIDSSGDEIIDDTVAHGFEWEVDEHPGVQPLNFDRDGSEGPVWNDIPTYQQKQSQFTWDLERRKRLKLGTTKDRKLYERHLDSDSNSSGSGQNRKHGGDSNIGRKKKHLSVSSDKSGKKSRKSVKKSSGSVMLKRQSLLKLLMDKMNSNIDGEFPPFDQHPQFDYDFKHSQPLIFSFEDEPADIPEQNDELDTLWADFDFALESENIGTYYDDEHQGETNVLNLGLGSSTPCSRGKHEFILDDQIGIRCKYCSLVNLEIRYVLPSVVSNYSEKYEWRNGSFLKDSLMYHDLCEQAGTVDGQSQDFHLYGTVWDLIPGAITTMYQHQREAFEFMWTNLVGDIRLDELKHGAKPDVVGGCVICHAPGTGKTRLAIVFIQTYMKVFPNCRPVIIAPRGMLFAWEQEFKKWDVNVPFHIMNTTDYTGKEDGDICRLIKKKHRTEKLTRLVKLLSWNKGHGILGISYGLYMKLTSEKAGCTGENKVRSILLENPGLLVLDEGHTPRNERSIMWKTLGKVKTEKRIILSGTPFQNNFLELYNILCLVRPRFGEMFLTKTKVGRRHHVSKKQRDKFSDKYEKGVWASLTSNVTDDNAEKVRSILKPFVHIHNGTILRTLPGLRESVIVLKPPPLQKSIIRKVENIGSGNNFEHEYVISLASTHPSLVTSINMSEEEASLIDKTMLQRLRSNPYEGVKTRFVIEVVRLCEALKEKVLIFSQFIQPLELIKEHLRKFFKWREGKEILQMDGKIQPRYRQNSIEVFNNPDSDARVLLASTRACCEGISLTGASRVVLLDVVWNPAVGRQAISRAFRIGQKKFVYTYNLITYGTGEGDKYDRQAEKDHLSKLVFSAEDEFGNVRNMLSKAEMDQCSKLISQDIVLEEMASHDQLKGMFLKIHYPPTESNMVFTYNQISPELT
uniref:Uncharacterized protein n=1 Tax=Avena sativa TaxID=4498 RepID=A0ACD5U301_AVESA